MIYYKYNGQKWRDMCLIQDDLAYNKYIKVNNVSVAFTVCDL